MKRLVLVMVCILIMIVFIAFNYLLWDRENKDRDIENLKYANINSSSRINAYEREIKSLEDEIKQLKASLSNIEKQNGLLEESKAQLEKDREEYNKLIGQKNELINILKQNVDLKPMEAPVKKWVEAVNGGEYENAYALQSSLMREQSSFKTMVDFTNSFKDKVKSLKLKSIKLATENIPDSEKGDIIFNVVLDANMAEGSEAVKDGFEEGANERFFTVDYDAKKSDWVITSIENSL